MDFIDKQSIESLNYQGAKILGFLFYNIVTCWRRFFAMQRNRAATMLGYKSNLVIQCNALEYKLVKKN